MNIRINTELKALLDWGCSLRPEADIPFITRAALKKHERDPVDISKYQEFTTSSGNPVTFPDVAIEDTAKFKAIIAAYLINAFESWSNMAPLELDPCRNYK